MRRVVSDTGPILHLHEANALHLLTAAGEVLIPPAVDRELTRLIPNWAPPDGLDCRPLSSAGRKRAEAWTESGLIDPGEASAVVLAEELSADWFLTDDTAARVVAGGLGLEVHGALGVVLWAAAVGRLDRDAATATLRQLFESSLWVSPRVRTEALALLDDLFAPG
ncbi:MAG TPA: hypothetical protein VKU40_06950 [Thermoanaerobaculia bacterium]|nr:hypothetical protein [Thermoanaerobaculia bacterium]